MKSLPAFAMLASFFLLGCVLDSGHEGDYFYNEAALLKKNIPQECLQKRECELLSCISPTCSCTKDSAPFRSRMGIYDEKDARVLSQHYLNTYSPGSRVTLIKSLNPAFYEVSYESREGSRQAFLVSADGVILKAECA